MHILILYSHLCLGLPSGLFSLGFLKNFVCTSHVPHVCCHIMLILYSILTGHCNIIW